MMSEYDLEHKGIRCTGVDWEKNIFYFTVNGLAFEFCQQEYIESSADTDHIRAIIDRQFYPWYTKILERALYLACKYYLEVQGYQKHDSPILAGEYVMPEIIKEAEKELEEQRNAKIYRRE